MTTPTPADPTRRFSDRADDYRAARPSYPPAAIDAMLAGLGGDAPRAPLTAADIGAGTGIVSRLLADRGARVIAVEPNDAMRAAAESDATADHRAHIEWRAAAAERTGIATASAHLVVAAQAYHWFDQPRACAEFARIILRPGRLALLWNVGDETTPLARGYYAAVRGASTQPPDQPISSYEAQAHGPRVFPPFTDARLRATTHPHTHPLTADALVARARSASYVPKSGPAWDHLRRALLDLHARLADPATGLAPFHYIARLWLHDLP